VSALRTEPTHGEGRPGERAALSVNIGDLHSVPSTTDHLAHLDNLAEALRGYLVLQVVVDDAGHRRTNLYRSAAAAQRAVGRARSRGRAVHVSLCQLLPVGVVQGLEVA